MRLLAAAVLMLGFVGNVLADPAAPVEFNSHDFVLEEDFDAYRGSEATLPAGFWVEYDGTEEPFQGINVGALTAYTSDDSDYSFGIREKHPVPLKDARVFLAIKNMTGQAIAGFEISYDVEAWFIGDERDRIRMKYDMFLTKADAGDRRIFETDVFSTDNPSSETVSGTPVNGKLAANRMEVSGSLDLATFSDGDGGMMGALPDGATAYFRWQISKATGDSGSTKSALAIDNLQITPVFEEAPPSIRINEAMASNSSILADEDGDFDDWIELYNASDEAISLLGWGLSDKGDDQFRWVFPDVIMQPGAFLLVWATGKDRRDPESELHANFGISSDGEQVFLTHADGTPIDAMPLKVIPSDMSFGRKPDATGEWFLFLEPTPGESNTKTGYVGISAPPALTPAPGLYADTVMVDVERVPGIEYRYTLDGSIPTQESPLFETALEMTDRAGDTNVLSMIPSAEEDFWHGGPQSEIKKLNTLRVCAFQEGFIPGETVASYLIDPLAGDRYEFPVISIVTEYSSLFDPDTGLFIPQNYLNRGEEWERLAHIEWFEQGAIGFAQNIGIRIHGGFSRKLPLKSLRLYARSRYGKSAIEYPIFPGRENNRHERLLLRSGGSTWDGVLFRDAFSQFLITEVSDVGHQDYRPTVVFINGELWGIMNARDRLDEEFLANQYGVDEDRVDTLENGVVDKGSDETYEELLAFWEQQDLNIPENYQWVADRVDVAEFRDYHALQLFIMNH